MVVVVNLIEFDISAGEVGDSKYVATGRHSFSPTLLT